MMTSGRFFGVFNKGPLINDLEDIVFRILVIKEIEQYHLDPACRQST